MERHMWQGQYISENTDPQVIDRAITGMVELRNSMVGTLYPAALTDEIYAIERLKYEAVRRHNAPNAPFHLETKLW